MTPDAFFQDIIAHPDDDAPRLVYADWLDDHGDPARAEFIRVGCRRAALPAGHPDRPGLERRERELLTEYRRAWAGDIIGRVRRMHWHRGFVEEVSLLGPGFLEHWDRLFALAPLQSLRLHNAGGVLAAVAASPRLARVTALRLHDNRYPNRIDARRLEPLARSPHPRRLRRLDLHGNPLGRAGTALLLDAPFFEHLTALRLSYTGLDAGCLGALAGSPRAARLRVLDLTGNNLGVEGWQALTESPHLGGLEELVATDTYLNAAAVEVLVRSRLPGQLKKLDLRRGGYLGPLRATLKQHFGPAVIF